MKVLKFLFLFIPVFLISIACKEDPIFDGNATVEFQFQINKDKGNLAKAAGDISFQSGYIVIREIVFDGDRQGQASVSISHEQISTIDFATGVASPPVNVEIPAGEYNSVNLGIEIQDENDDPTIVMEGEFERADGTITPIRFEFGSGEVFEAEAESASVASNIPAIAKITFDPVSWFNGVSMNRMENAKLDANGVIVISETQNSGIFDLVADGLDRNTEAVFQ